MTNFSTRQIRTYLFLFLIFSTINAIKVNAQTRTQGLIKHITGTQENGYVLFSPIRVDTTYLIDRCGKKVHQWTSDYTPGMAMYLKPDGHLLRAETYNDTVFGAAGGRGGLIEEFDWDNNLIWQYKIFNDSLCQHHDIKPLPNGNILVLAWHAISSTQAFQLGRDSINYLQNKLWGERIIELKPIGSDSAEVVWQWDLFDHLIQDRDPAKPSYGIISNNPQLVDINYAHDLATYDWVHANGIDYNEELDQIVMSCHNFSEIWIIDHSTTTAEAKTHSGGNTGSGGDLLYRWGNPQAYDRGTAANRKLFRQHNAQWIPNGFKDSGCIMVFNNGWGRDTAYSSIDIIKPPLLAKGKYNNALPYLPSTLTWRYMDPTPTKFYSQIISGTQRLQNGNTLICSGVQGRFFEVDQNKKIVWEYRNPISDIAVLSDGDNPRNNNVFRCTFYPDNYSAFLGKTLTPYGTLEKSTGSYPCFFESKPPKVNSLSPFKNQTSVALKPTIQIEYDKPVLKNKGLIQIFENNTLLETINMSSNKVSINQKTVSIQPNSTFKNNAVISISVPAYAFKDSINNLSEAIDSSDWHFYTIKTQLILDSIVPKHLSKDILLNQTIKLIFKEAILKNTSGSVIIYENNLFKESILIGSPKIVINGNTATITTSAPFKTDATINIEVGTCFVNSTAALNQPISKNNWQFNTITTPKITSLSPSHQSNGIVLNPTIIITYNHPIKLLKSGKLFVYQNGQIFDIITVGGPRSMIAGNAIQFDLSSDLMNGAHVAIALEANLLSDTFGTNCAAIDSVNWHFSTVKSSGLQTNNSNSQFSVFPNPNHGTFTLKSAMEIENLALFDGQGRNISIEVNAMDAKQTVLKLSQYAPGLYILRINHLHTIQLIIE